MKQSVTLLLFLTLFIMKAAPVLAQEASGPKRLDELSEDWKRTGQAAMPFLAKGAGARLMAMGDAGIALTGDASALFYNPAGIAHVENRSLMLGSMAWLLDTQIHSGAFAINLGELGVLGVSGMFFDYGDPIQGTVIDATVEAGYRDTDEFNPTEFVVGIGYARRISDEFAVGGQVKYAYQDLLGGGLKTSIAYQDPDAPTGWVQEEHDAKQGVLAFDIGTIYNTGFRDLMLAMSFRNFSSEVKYEREPFDIPLTFRFGITGDVFSLLGQQLGNMDLAFHIDYLHPRDWGERMNVGLEYNFNDLVYVRGGYKVNYSSEGLCLGGGLNLNLPMGAVRIDYAYKDTQESLFDAVHVYSLNLDF